jgi:hypothetical protein
LTPFQRRSGLASIYSVNLNTGNTFISSQRAMRIWGGTNAFVDQATPLPRLINVYQCQRADPTNNTSPTLSQFSKIFKDCWPYCLSGALMEHFAIYPGWAALSLSHPSSTPSIPKIAPLITAHSSQSLAIVYIYALPKVLVTGCIIAQLVHEQTGNPLVQSRNVGNQLAQ